MASEQSTRWDEAAVGDPAVSLEALRSVIQVMPQGVVIVDRRGTVQLANERAEELTGRTAAELGNIAANRPWRMYALDGHELAQEERPLVRALTTGVTVPTERIRVVRDDGTERFLDFAATPVHGPDGVDSVIATFQDVTQQETRERAERDFITNAAHELQTPLAAIASAVEVLQAGAKERQDDRDRFLAHIERSCARLDRLTRALLVLARAQTGDEAPRREVVAVEPLIRAVAGSLPSEADIEIEVACAPDVAVVANRPLLEQAVANLAQNAVKHTRGKVFLSATRADGRVEILVGDSGPGIPVDARPRIFERFFRAGEAAGFGLGLAIVSEAVKALDGELRFETSPEGTTFAITLPSVRILGP